MENTNFKRFFLAPVLATSLVGAGYGISKAVKTPDAPATTAAKSSEIAMVPANFTELAEKVRPRGGEHSGGQKDKERCFWIAWLL